MDPILLPDHPNPIRPDLGPDPRVTTFTQLYNDKSTDPYHRDYA
jgi:hypothetical protein